MPDLNIVVSDADVNLNAEYDLQIEDVKNSLGVFSVYPRKAVGRYGFNRSNLSIRMNLTTINFRTPVIIRVENPERLDYETEEGKNFVFKVNALQGEDFHIQEVRCSNSKFQDKRSCRL